MITSNIFRILNRSNWMYGKPKWPFYVQVWDEIRPWPLKILRKLVEQVSYPCKMAYLPGQSRKAYDASLYTLAFVNHTDCNINHCLLLTIVHREPNWFTSHPVSKKLIIMRALHTLPVFTSIYQELLSFPVSGFQTRWQVWRILRYSRKQWPHEYTQAVKMS